MVTVFSSGQMGENIKEIGIMENSMVKEFILDRMGKREKENGRRGRESSGLRKMETNSESKDLLIQLHYVKLIISLVFSALLPDTDVNQLNGYLRRPNSRN